MLPLSIKRPTLSWPFLLTSLSVSSGIETGLTRSKVVTEPVPHCGILFTAFSSVKTSVVGKGMSSGDKKKGLEESQIIIQTISRRLQDRSAESSVTSGGAKEQLNISSRVQEVSTHGQTAKDHITLIDHGNVAAGDLHLRSDSPHNQQLRAEDQTAGFVESTAATIIIMDTSVQCRLSTSSTSINVGTLLRASSMSGFTKSPVLVGAVAPVVPPYAAPFTQERNVHGLVDLDSTDDA